MKAREEAFVSGGRNILLSEGKQAQKDTDMAIKVVTPRVTVSGTFRRAMSDVQDVVQALADAGAVVLSPANPRIVDRFGDFVFVASDLVRHLRMVQARHLAAIAASDFVWLIAPDGYIGQSAAMEIGFAAAHAVPVYSTQVPCDLTLRQWVITVSSVGEALARTSVHAEQSPSAAILLDPTGAIDASHDDLEVAGRGLLGAPAPQASEDARLALLRVRSRLLVP